MAFIRVWTNNQSGNVPANTIDTLFANLRQDIQQRMDQIFNNWASDPLVLQDFVTGKRTGKKMFIPPAAFHGSMYKESVTSGITTTEIDHTLGDVYLEAKEGSGTWRAPLILPPFSTIKTIRWLVTASNANTVTMKLIRGVFNTGGIFTVLNTITKAQTGVEIKSSGLVTIPVTEDGPMSLTIDMAGTSTLNYMRIHGVEVTYEVSDSRYTL